MPTVKFSRIIVLSLQICGLSFLTVSLMLANLQTNVRANILPYERVITDLEDVYNGVAIDFGYNESNTAGGLSSVPGCPKSVEGYPWVYYGSPMKCYLVGERGPCAPDQKLFIELGSLNGFCNCDCFEGFSRSENADGVEFCTSIDNREHVFISETKKCFALYDQGPCKFNEWLVKLLSENGNITHCEFRKCPQGQIPEEASDRQNSSNSFSCFSPVSLFAGPVSILPNECESDGMVYSKLLRKCIKKVAFNFG